MISIRERVRLLVHTPGELYHTHMFKYALEHDPDTAMRYVTKFLYQLEGDKNWEHNANEIFQDMAEQLESHGYLVNKLKREEHEGFLLSLKEKREHNPSKEIDLAINQFNIYLKTFNILTNEGEGDI